MVLVIDAAHARDCSDMLKDMHRMRKAVFVDGLGWRLPVTRDGLEIDQFDTADAVYLLDVDAKTLCLNASVRLLPTVRPHVLGDLFDQTCDNGAPRSEDVWEISRLCTAPRLDAEAALWARRRICLGLVEYGLLNGIDRYSCVINTSWLAGFLRPGWVCEPLGAPVEINGETLGAFTISVSPATRQKFLDQWRLAPLILAFPEQVAA
ncbi:MAG: acyl-homoserine-lactone synthase [Hyphomonadaceae bacterium]